MKFFLVFLVIPYPEPCLFTESFQRLNGERGTERFTRASKSTCVALKGGLLDTSTSAERAWGIMGARAI